MNITYPWGGLSPERPGPQQAAPGVRLSRREKWAVWLWLPLALALALNFKCAVVSGHSMLPTFRNGQHLLVWRSVPSSLLRPGDVVVFRGDDGVEMIKRIVLIDCGTPTLVRTLYTTRDGTHRSIPLAMVFASYMAACDMGQRPPPAPGQDIYVVGDNYEDSFDSRDYGPISPHQILGKVLF